MKWIAQVIGGHDKIQGCASGMLWELLFRYALSQFVGELVAGYQDFDHPHEFRFLIVHAGYSDRRGRTITVQGKNSSMRCIKMG